MGNKRIIAVLRFPDDIPGKIIRCTTIKDCITGNTFFTTPTPSMATFGSDISKLIEAQATLDSGKAGGTADRDAALDVLAFDATRLLNYVQGIADATPAEAEQIIESAGMFIKAHGGKKTQSYKAHSELSGTVRLTVPSFPIPRPVVWEISSDNVAWSLFKVSRLSDCTKGGLNPGQLYYFRYYSIDENNEDTPRSETISCRVI